MVVCPDPSLTLSCVDVWVRAGSSFEAPDEIGAAHFLEHVIFKGTATHGAGEMDLRIENVGASLNASTSRDWAHFHTTVATPYLDTAIDILADALQNPLFDPAEVARERRVVLAEIAGRQSEPAQILDDSMGPLLYGEHPYGRPVYGTVDNVESLTAETIRKFFKRNYTGQAMTVVVVGNVEPEDAFRRIAAGFGSVVSGAASVWPDGIASPGPQSVDLSKAGDGSEWMCFAMRGPGMDTPADVWAMDVLISALVRQGDGVLYDRLVKVDKSAPAVDISFLTQHLPARVTITLVSSPGKLAENERAIREVLNAVIREGVPPVQLEQAKRYLLGTYAFEVETAGGQGGSIGFYAVIGSIRDSMQYSANVQAVSAADVLRVAGKYLDPDRASVVRMAR